MRKIRFRAWDGKKMWVDFPTYLLLDIATGKIFNTVEDQYMPTETYELMQFTGLHDSTGREIYEGDIVKWYNKNTVLTVHAEMKGEIGQIVFDWRRASFGGRFDSHPTGNYTMEYAGESWEIIGNIYENPELLGARQ